MFIAKEQIDYIYHSVPIEDVIISTGYRMVGTGKSRGVETCPKCGRDHTHIKVNTKKNLFNCYSKMCGFKGNQFQWIMETNSVSFQEAVRMVATIGNIQINYETQMEKEFEVRKQTALKIALSFYRSKPSQYLRNRGISDETARKYQVGFAPGGKNLKTELNNHGFNDEFISTIGLIREIKGTGYMDRFYKSVIIPDIRNGKIHDLYARSVDEKISTKHMYLYGQRSVIGSHLVKRGGQVIICEGPINALSAYQITNIPAISIGGAGKFDSWQLRNLKQADLQPLLCFDNDGTGLAATVAAIEALNKEKIHSKVITTGLWSDINELLINDNIKNMGELIIDSQLFMYNHYLSKVPVPYIEKYLHNITSKSV